MKNKFPVKSLPDGRAMLNVACGSKMHHQWNNIDFSPYAKMRKHMPLARMMHSVGVLSELRWQRLQTVDPEMRCYDLRKGIPWADETFEVVYHSHFLEHVPREFVPTVLEECLRVLKQGGVLRVVVPDLQDAMMHYNESWQRMEQGDESALAANEAAIAEMFDQMVRSQAKGLREQTNPVARSIDRLLRSDPNKTGELHKWMYNRFTLTARLKEAGFKQVQEQDFRSSKVAGWEEFKLDLDETGNEYKTESLYVEGVK